MGLFQTLACGKSGQARGVTYKMEATSAGHSSCCPPFALPALAFLFSQTFCFSSCFTRFHIGTPHLIETASSKERLQKVFCKIDFV